MTNGCVDPKVQDSELTKFNGDTGAYKLWWSRIRDHLCASHQSWGRLLDLAEKHRIPMTFQYLQGVETVDDFWLDLPHLSRDLWAFLGPDWERLCTPNGYSSQEEKTAMVSSSGGASSCSTKGAPTRWP